jgi:NADH dehydrogenase
MSGSQRSHRVVIIGGGFGGLRAAQGLDGAPVEITLIDRHNYHLFQPLLYQVATGGLSPANIAAPLRDVLKRQHNARVLMANVRGIDVGSRLVDTDDEPIPYDSLIVATGSENNYFGHETWARLAPGLKSIEDATIIRARIISALEAAEKEHQAPRQAALLTFVVIGGGPTGVELAGALAELARDTLRNEFRSISAQQARVILVEAADRILLAYPPELSAKARRQLEALGVQVRTGCTVEDIRSGDLLVQTSTGEEHIAAHTILWSAGMRATPLGALLCAQTGTSMDRAGRVQVDDRLNVPGHPEVFVIGDLAHVKNEKGALLPATAPVALQQGQYAARLIRARLSGENLPPFRFRNRGQLATIGRSAAVAELPHFQLSGWPAWVIWLFVHLMQLVRHENRVLVFIQWMFNYFTRNRSARLITDYSSRATRRDEATFAP